MNIKNKPIRFLFRILRAIWKFPWLRVTVVSCLIGYVGLNVFQGLDAARYQSNVSEFRQEEQVLGDIKNMISPEAFAEDPPPPPPATPPAEEEDGDDEDDSTTGAGVAKLQESLFQVAQVLAQVAQFLLKIVGGLLMFMLYWMSDLMDNTFILDGSMGEKLQIIWIFIRNIINVAFAIILVVVAFINVAGYGAGEGSYAIKKFLPKMALALIAVNFTFLGARVILDVNNVLTTAVLALPQSVPDVGQFTAQTTQPLKMYAKYKCSFNKEELQPLLDKVINAGAPTVGGSGDTGLVSGVPVGSFFDVCVADIEGSKAVAGADSEGLVEVGNLNQLRTQNFVWVLATRYQGIQNIAKRPIQAKDWESLLLNANFGFIFGVIYATAYLAMFIILIVRVVVLWICIALSPLIALEILMPDLMGAFKIGESDLKSMFIDHAFVPLKMAVPMSIGFVMISQMSLVGVGDFSKDIILTGGEFTRDGSIHRILYGVASVALIWIGVFSAASKVQGKQIIEKIKGGVESVGKFVAKAPLQTLPIVPIAGGIPISALGTMWKTIESVPGTHARGLGEEAARAMGFGTESQIKQATANIALRDLQRSNSNENIGRVVNNWGGLNEDGKRAALVELIKDSPSLQLRDGQRAEDFIKENREGLRTHLINNHGVDGTIFDREIPAPGAATAAATAPATAADAAQQASNALLTGNNTINVTVSAAAAVTGFAAGEHNLTGAQLKQLLEQLVADPAKLETALRENESLRNLVIANPAALERFSGLTNKERIGTAIFNAFHNQRLATNQTDQANRIITALGSLGVSGKNVADIIVQVPPAS